MDRPKVRIIRMRKVPFVDSTGIHNLTNLCEMSKKEGIQIVLSGVREKVNGQLELNGPNAGLRNGFGVYAGVNVRLHDPLCRCSSYQWFCREEQQIYRHSSL